MVAFPGPALVAVLNTVKLNFGRRLVIILQVSMWTFGLVNVGAYWTIVAYYAGQRT